MFFYYLAIGIYVLICFLLLVVVLLQQGKGGDIAAAFGGASRTHRLGRRFAEFSLRAERRSRLAGFIPAKG